MTTITGSFADGAIASSVVAYQITFTMSEAATASELWSYTFVAGNGADGASATASEAYSTQMIRQAASAVSATAADTLTAITLVSMTQSGVASDAANATLAPVGIAAARASDAAQPTLIYSATVTAAATARDTFGSQSWLAAAGSATAVDVVSYAYIAGAGVIDTARASELWQDTRVVNAAIAVSAVVTATLAPSIVYDAAISDAAVSSDFEEPSGSVTTWAINTRTNAVTQYRNFAFNSFAAMGRKYIAADADGVYELDGAQDDTAPVIGDFGGGQFQPAAGKLAGFKGVYIGARTYGGSWQTTLDAGDGRQYVYQTKANPGLMTTKVTVGKGLRSRYFGWRVTAIDGQDFDFDSIEFVPSVSGRRVDG